MLCGYSHKLMKLRKSEVMLVTYVPDLYLYIDDMILQAMDSKS